MFVLIETIFGYNNDEINIYETMLDHKRYRIEIDGRTILNILQVMNYDGSWKTPEIEILKNTFYNFESLNDFNLCMNKAKDIMKELTKKCN